MRKLRAPDGENPAAPKSMVAFGEVGDVGRVGDPNAPWSEGGRWRKHGVSCRKKAGSVNIESRHTLFHVVAVEPWSDDVAVLETQRGEPEQSGVFLMSKSTA